MTARLTARHRCRSSFVVRRSSFIVLSFVVRRSSFVVHHSLSFIVVVVVVIVVVAGGLNPLNLCLVFFVFACCLLYLSSLVALISLFVVGVGMCRSNGCFPLRRNFDGRTLV